MIKLGAEPTQILAATGIAGFAAWQLLGAYQSMAPSMSEVREASRHDISVRQRMLDADICTGGLAIIAGGVTSVLTKSVIPLLLVVIAFAWISGYHHSVQQGPTTKELG